MNPDIMQACGFSSEVELIASGICPFCSLPIAMSDFKDPLSVKEFYISGLCQSCQDDFFNP